MAGNPDGLRSLEKWSKVPVGCIIYVRDASADTIRAIDRGIVFLMAFWSIDSIRAFVELTEALSRVDIESIDLVVIDVDGADQLASYPDFTERISAGAGETFWVRHGRIVAKSLYPSSHAACFESNTAALLAMS